MKIDHPQPASVRTVRSKLSEVEADVRMALRELGCDHVHDNSVNALARAIENLGQADMWMDHVEREIP